MARDIAYTSQSRAHVAPGSESLDEERMAGESDLAFNLDAIGLPADARAWLLGLWNAIQVLDDAMDDDPTIKEDVSRAIWDLFVAMPMNEFYQRNAGTLTPILALQILKWEAANLAEGFGIADAKSYMWRAGYYDVVLMACHLCGIKNAGVLCMGLYGETLDEYLEGL